MQEKMRFHIESEQPGRNEAMNEWLDEHRAIFTALDENFPTPEEITSEEVLMLPEIQSMSAYIRQHFEEEIAYVAQGEAVILFEDEEFVLSEGDTVRILPSRKHKFRNPGVIPLKVLFIKSKAAY